MYESVWSHRVGSLMQRHHFASLQGENVRHIVVNKTKRPDSVYTYCYGQCYKKKLLQWYKCIHNNNYYNYDNTGNQYNQIKSHWMKILMLNLTRYKRQRTWTCTRYKCWKMTLSLLPKLADNKIYIIKL